MLPDLELFSRRIPTYGVAVAIGIALGYWYLRRRTRALPPHRPRPQVGKGKATHP